MSDLAIRALGLSKLYRIGAPQAKYRTLRESATDIAAAPFRHVRSLFRGASQSANGHSTMWALKDVSFEIRPGEVVGIIGRNGSGKSTLLKILSRVTEPTEGSAEIRGRVGSLLEVGTGFHPELTGRENIYLNGAILGMRRADITRKFDAIVAFAEVDQFIDTAVKHYSSGMYLRLAFAVAAHLDPEILLVDEVLAVGDAAFQKKCIGKMSEAAGEGRTVLFVSHNMAAVRSLCSTGVVLESGRVLYRGAINDAIQRYHAGLASPQSSTSSQRGRFADVCVNGINGNAIGSGEPFQASCTLRPSHGWAGFRVACVVQSETGEEIIAVSVDSTQLDLPADAVRISTHFPGLWLKPGVYSLFFKVFPRGLCPNVFRVLSDTVMLDIVARDVTGPFWGYVTPKVEWRSALQTDV